MSIRVWKEDSTQSRQQVRDNFLDDGRKRLNHGGCGVVRWSERSRIGKNIRIDGKRQSIAVMDTKRD